MNSKDFQVNYSLNVTAGKSIDVLDSVSKSINSFGTAVGILEKSSTAINNFNASLQQTFGNSGRKTRTLKINTKDAVQSLKKVDNLLKKINGKASKLNGKTRGIDFNSAKANASLQKTLNLLNKLHRKKDVKINVTQTTRKVGATPPPNTIGIVNPKTGGAVGGMNNIRNAAMRRMHYSHLPNMSSIPFAGMVNAYVVYSMMTAGIKEAVEFTHTMDAAKNVLANTDSDLATFGARFASMTDTVRQIGVDTRFTMAEMAKATQFMAQAGFSPTQIEQSIKPIANLALIADAPIADIADNVTGVLSGYRVDTASSGSLADQIASTYTRSKATVSEISESFKMSAGFLEMAGVDISEAIAAFGVLGNANLKGTMAGTSMRSIMTFLAKPSKQAKETFKKLGVEVTETVDVYGRSVTKLKPLAAIFSELKEKGATLEDMGAIFGKIGGTGAMVLVNRAQELLELTELNKGSQGLSARLAEAKQNTVSGKWSQVNSAYSESFTQAFEKIQPRILVMLNDLTNKLSTPDFVAGLRSVGESMATIFQLVTSIGIFLVENWERLEPIIIGGTISKSIYKFIGVLVNLRTALLGVSSAKAVGGLVEAGGAVNSLSQGLANTINTSGGMTGATASIGAMGGAAVAASAGISALVGALGFGAYKYHQLLETRKAFNKEMEESRKYTFPSLEALQDAIRQTIKLSNNASASINAITDKKTLNELMPNATHNSNNFFENMFYGADNLFRDVLLGGKSGYYDSIASYDNGIKELREKAEKARSDGNYSLARKYEADASRTERDKLSYQSSVSTDLYNQKFNNAAAALAEKDTHEILKSTVSTISKYNTESAAEEAIRIFDEKMSKMGGDIDPSLYIDGDVKGNVKPYLMDKEGGASIAVRTKAYSDRIEEMRQSTGRQTLLNIKNALAGEQSALDIFFGGKEGAKSKIEEFEAWGFKKNADGTWSSPKVSNPDDKDEVDRVDMGIGEANKRADELIALYAKRHFYDDVTLTKAVLAKANIMPLEVMDSLIKKTKYAYTGSSNFRDVDANEYLRQLEDMEDSSQDLGGESLNTKAGKAGRNYGGAGMVSGASAPRQINVNIQNLMNIESINLLKENESEELNNLQDQLTQLLVDVVHDHDATWNT